MSDKKMKNNPFNKDSVLEMLKNTLIILVITLVAGLILGVVNEFTKSPIAEMEKKIKDDANKVVFNNAARFSENILDESLMNELFQNPENGYENIRLNYVLEAYNSEGELIGYVMEVLTKEGFGGDIVFSIGIGLNGTTNGIKITSISETAGLGMKAQDVLAPQFTEKNSDNFVVTKNGAVMENEIDAITSATITSKAVVKGVNAAIFYFRNINMGGVANE